LLYRIGSGVGEGLYNVAIYTFLGSLTLKRRGTSIGVGASLFGIGAFTGPLIATYSLAATGDWRIPFFVFGGVGILGAVIAYFIVKPSDVDPVPHKKMVEAEGSSKHGLAAFKDKRVIPVSVTMLAAGLALYSYISVYSVFLQRANNIGLIDSGFIIGLFGIGNILGGAPMGYIADLIGRKWAVGTYALLAAVLSLLVFGMGGSVILYGIVGFLYGALVNALYTNSYATIQEIVPPSMMGVGTGYVATLYFLMAAVSGYVMTQGATLYGWPSAGIAIVALPLLVAAFITFGLSGGRPKSK
jgi:MFS family permease